jgi:hypothetical protein
MNQKGREEEAKAKRWKIGRIGVLRNWYMLRVVSPARSELFVSKGQSLGIWDVNCSGQDSQMLIDL